MKTKFLAILGLSLCLSVSAQTKKWTIQECIAYAVENNISLKQQVLNSELAEQDIQSAKGNFMPDLFGSASQNWNVGSSIGQNGVRISRDTRGNNFGLNSGMTLYNGKQNRNTLSQSRLGLEIQDLQGDILKDDITIRILTQYVDALAQKENLKIAQEQVAITEKQISQIQEFVNAGVNAKSDLLDVKAQLATDQELVVNSESNVLLSLLALTELLQISHNGFDIEDIDLDISAVSLLYDNPDEIYAKAVENRAEIQKAKVEIESSELDVEIAKGNYYPTLTMGAGLGTSYQHSQGEEDLRPTIPDPSDPSNVVWVDNGFGQQLSDNLGYNFGFRLSVPIFNRTHTKTNVNRRKINELRAQNNLDQQKQDLEASIVRVYSSARTSLNQYKAAAASVEAQEENFRNAQESFDLGVMTSFEFEQVRIRLLNAQSAFVNAKYNFIYRTKALEYYTGLPISIGETIN